MSVHDLKTFAPNLTSHPCPTVVAVGKRNSGKTCRILGLASEYNIDTWIVMTGSIKAKLFWTERLGQDATVWGIDDRSIEKLEAVIQKQTEKYYWYVEGMGLKDLPANERVGLILDDVTAYPKFMNKGILGVLFCNGRNYGMATFLMVQYWKGFTTTMRSNIDYLLMCINTPAVNRMIYKELVRGLPTEEHWETLCNAAVMQCDEHGNTLYNAIVYDLTGISMDPRRMFKLYHNPPNFKTLRLGSDEMRQKLISKYHDPVKERRQREYTRKKRRLAQRHSPVRQDPFLGTLQADTDWLEDKLYSAPPETHDTVHLNGMSFRLPKYVTQSGIA